MNRQNVNNGDNIMLTFVLLSFETNSIKCAATMRIMSVKIMQRLGRFSSVRKGL